MNSELQKAFDATERQRAELKATVSSLSEAQLNWSPDNSAWSILQIVDHLVRSSGSVQKAFATGVQELEFPMSRLLPQSLRRALILGALNRDMTLPMPSKGLMPGSNAKLPELYSNWEVLSTDIRRFIEPLNGDEKKYTHPAMGPLTLLQTLELGRVHTAYHARQIERLRLNPLFPG